MKNSFLIKVRREDLVFLSRLYGVTKKILNSMGKSFNWLQFARKKRRTFRFLPNKVKQWNTLIKIAMGFSKKYPYFNQGQVVDLLSELVNLSVKSYIGGVKNDLPKSKERIYIAKKMIEIVGSKYYIPWHPWIMPSGKISSRSWMGKDLRSGKEYLITKKKQGEFYIFSAKLD